MLLPQRRGGPNAEAALEAQATSEHRVFAVVVSGGAESGDEDLRERVSEAQERGVRVILVGVRSRAQSNISRTLAMEADRVIVLDKEFLRPFVSLRLPDPISQVDPGSPRDPRELGRIQAVAHIEQTGLETVAKLADGLGDSILVEVDRLLLAYACKALGVARLDSDQRSELRAGFRSAVADLGRTNDPCLHPPPPGNRITESRET
jgi:hypothetical protein